METPLGARVVVSSFWYPVGVCRYLERALRRLRDPAGRPFEVVSVGPSSGAGIPWGPQYRFPRYAFFPTIRLPTDPREARVRLSRIVQGKDRKHPFPTPDLWIDVDDGYFVDAPFPFPRAIIATDPHVRKYERQREVATGAAGARFWSMQAAYAKAGDEVLPYGFDEEAHFEQARPTYPYDVTILGAQYPQRRRLAEELERRGLRVLARMGDLFDECRDATCSAPVAVVWSLADDLPCRVFESMAMGRAVLVNRVSELDQHFEEGVHYEGFGGVGEAIEKALFLAANPFRARELALAATKAVFEEWGYGRPMHGWTSRAAKLLTTHGIAVGPGWVPCEGIRAAGAA